MNQPNQPAQNDKDSYIKQFVKRWMDGHEPDTFVKDTQGNVFYTAGHSTLNLIAFFEDLLEEYITDCEVTLQPAPKSAEEVLREIVPTNCIWEDMGNLTNTSISYVIEAMQNYASQFARYVTDEEIDAMWPFDQHNAAHVIPRQAAKAMRDMIFNNVKLKV